MKSRHLTRLCGLEVDKLTAVKFLSQHMKTFATQCCPLHR